MKYKIKINGYVYLHIPEHPSANINGYIAEHRLILEKKLGRLLTKNEDVHHLNKIVDDNRPENLEVQIKNAHVILHKTGSKHKVESKQKTSKTLKEAWKRGLFKKRMLPDRTGKNNPMFGRKATQKQLQGLQKGHGWNKGVKMPNQSKNRKRDERGRFL